MIFPPQRVVVEQQNGCANCECLAQRSDLRIEPEPIALKINRSVFEISYNNGKVMVRQKHTTLLTTVSPRAQVCSSPNSSSSVSRLTFRISSES